MEGRISINKITDCGSGKSHMQIIVEDESSSIQFLTVKMSLLDFAQAITGLNCVPIKFALRGIDRVGMKLEVKSENICIPHSATNSLIRQYIQAYEVDGWIGEDSDAKNHHNLVRGDWKPETSAYRVSFHRYV